MIFTPCTLNECHPYLSARAATLSMSSSLEPATIFGTRMRSVGMPKSEARLRTRYCESKKSCGGDEAGSSVKFFIHPLRFTPDYAVPLTSVVTSMPRDNTIKSTVLISSPGMPPHSST